MPERKIATGPGHPEITAKLNSGSERMSWRYPENYGFGDVGEDIQSTQTPTAPTPYYAPTDNPLQIAMKWFQTLAPMVKVGILGGIGFVVYKVWGEKKWR